MNCLYIYILLLYSILYIIAIRSSDSLDIKMNIKNFDFLLCRVITQDCLTFIIYYAIVFV